MRQPSTTDVTLDVALYPAARRMETRGRYRFVNDTGAPLANLHLRLPDTDTDLVAASVDTVVARTNRSAAEARAHFESSNPMGRLMTPEEVAQTAAWLAHPQSGGVTGQCIAVAGGEI